VPSPFLKVKVTQASRSSSPSFWISKTNTAVGRLVSCNQHPQSVTSFNMPLTKHQTYAIFPRVYIKQREERKNKNKTSTGFFKLLLLFAVKASWIQYLVIMRKDGRHLATYDRNRVFWNLIHSPSSRIQCMVSCLVPRELPAPWIQSLAFFALRRQHLLIHCLSIATQRQYELNKGKA
jgi:hypothetical protein